MSIHNITDNLDDWYIDSSSGRVDGTTTLKACYNRALFPTLICDAFGDIDTTTIPTTDVISAATLYFYIDSYTARKGTAKTFSVWMLKADETSDLLIDSGTFTAAGWYSVVLTAAEYAEVDKGGKTRIRITVPDSGAGKSRDMYVRAREYATVGTYDMYMDITHAAPVTARRLRMSMGMGR